MWASGSMIMSPNVVEPKHLYFEKHNILLQITCYLFLCRVKPKYIDLKNYYLFSFCIIDGALNIFVFQCIDFIELRITVWSN